MKNKREKGIDMFAWTLHKGFQIKPINKECEVSQQYGYRMTVDQVKPLLVSGDTQKEFFTHERV
jgi:hypothetical protein